MGWRITFLSFQVREGLGSEVDGLSTHTGTEMTSVIKRRNGFWSESDKSQIEVTTMGK